MGQNTIDHAPAVQAPASLGLATEHVLLALDPSGKDVEEGEDGEAQAGPALKRSTFKMSLVLLALALSLFISALDATVVATSAPTICSDLNSATGYIWVGGAYLLANTATTPIWGSLSDIYGRKAVMLLAVAMFFVASTICATARTMSTLIGGRAMQGMSGGGLILLVQICVSDLFSVRKRTLILGLTEAVWAIAGGTGPVLGGVFASATIGGWRWCFYINLPICAIAFLLLFLYLDIRHEKTSFMIGIRAIDWYGIAAFVAFTMMILLGLDFGGVVFAWSSAPVICLIVIGTCMIGAFIYSEAKLARYPIIPLSLFKTRSNLASLGVGFFHGLVFMPGEYYIPLYYQAVQQATPLRSGLLFIPFMVGTAGVGIITGIIIHKIGRYREVIWLGTAILTIGMGLPCLLNERTSTGEAIGLTIILGAGSGMLFAPPLIAIQAHTSQRDVATATSTFNFVRSIALSIAIILGGTVFQNSMDTQSRKLARLGLPPSITGRLTGDKAAANVALAGQRSDLRERHLIQAAFASSLRNMWILFTVCGGLAFLSSLFISRSVLSKEHVETVTGIRPKSNEGEHVTN